MPKYFKYKICGYYLYYTSFCIIECMHVHASDSKLTESGSAKFFVKSDGNTVVQKIGVLTDRGFGLFLHRISDEARIRYHSRLAALSFVLLATSILGYDIIEAKQLCCVWRGALS